jgi:D-alanyl-D-alanine carboxypeptidase/D-alanyl-D-alanine-endopeptidase (penicillin-binding protein 4)
MKPPRSRRAAWRVLAAWLLALVVISCGPKTPPSVAPAPPRTATAAATPPAPAPTAIPAAPGAATPATAPPPAIRQATAVDQLRSELDRLFNSPAFDRMLWGVQVQSLATGEILYRLNPTKLVMPASNMKIVTLAAAAERLGWDYTFETTLLAAGPIGHGVLKGDLVIVGSGDPTINGRSGNPTGVFEDWAARLREAGITAIEGQIVADDRAFDAESLGAGWSWDYLAYDYAAPVSALQYNENEAEIVIRAGADVGRPAVVSVRPEWTGLQIDNHVTTAAAGGRSAIELRRLPGSDRLDVAGVVPLGTETARAAAVDNPARFFAAALRSVLVKSGIRVRGDGVAIRDLDTVPDVSVATMILSRRSAPLSEIARVLMKVSQNLYAETLVKTLGLQAGAGTTEAGDKVVQEVIGAWGVEPGSYVLFDGSGLSRYNYVTAETIAQILRHVYMDPRLRAPFIDALPTAGVEGGTLARRFKGTRAAGNVHAKTGSISNVRALSGFVETADGEPLVFSIIANNFTQPQAAIDATTDLAVERLANFTRKPSGPIQ